MERPARIDFEADRWVAFIREIAFPGFDFFGATFAAQIRSYPDQPGDPLVNLGTVGASPSAQGVARTYSGTATIAAHIAAGRLTSAIYEKANPATGELYAAGDNLLLSVIRIRVNETTMEGLPYPPELGDDLTLYWDLHITPDGSIKEKFAGGKFIVRAGVTQ